MAGEFDLKGLEPAIQRMKTLAPKLQKRGLRAALRKGANIVKATAITNALRLDDRDTAEQIAKNVTAQFSRRAGRREGGEVIRVGIIGGARQYVNTRQNRRLRRVGQEYFGGVASGAPGGQTWYWRLLEFGTARFGAKPFLGPALDSNVARVIETFAIEMERQLDRAMREGLAGR